MLAWSLLACRGAELEVLSAEEVGLMPRTEAIEGRDGGPSALAFGRSVWTYGDTVLTLQDPDGSNWHTNSFEHASPDAWREGFEVPVDEVGAPRFFVELTEEEQDEEGWALWPSAPLQGTDRAWVLYGLYHELGPSGIGVASWEGLDQPVVRHRVGESWLLFPAPETEWANAPLVQGEHLYAFGCRPKELARPCGLARVPLSAVDQRDSWQFYDGHDWTADSSKAKTLFDGAPIMSASYNRALQRWWVVYAPPFAGEIVARTAPELTGPWSRPVSLVQIEGDPPYDAVHHAELEEADGAVQWLTYSRSNGQGWFGAEHVLWRVEVSAR